MRRTTVADVMSRGVISVDPQEPFADIAARLYTAAIRAVPVLDADGVLLGVVSEADLMATAARPDPATHQPRWWRPRHIRRNHLGAKAGATTAAALMTSPVETVSPGTTVAAAARRMDEHDLRWMPVTDEAGQVVGVLSRSDVLAVFLRDDAAIRTEVVEDVFGRALLVEPARVGVDVRQGVVTLAGELETRADTELAERFTERVEGVVVVVNQLGYRVDERLADSRIGPFY